jgi:diguanylate cyclase (GGDEF)-like protein
MLVLCLPPGRGLNPGREKREVEAKIMIAAPVPRDETARLAALHTSGLLGTPDDYPLDCLTNLGAQLFGVPICTVSLVDADRQWFKSCVGLGVTHTSRDISFCGHVIANGLFLIVEDTLRDVRFADNPLTADGHRIRFYAGYPIRGETGEVLGTLCLMDVKPRAFPARKVRLLRELTVLVQVVLANRRTSLAQTALVSKLEVARRESMLDPLLRIWNRRGITAILEQQPAHPAEHPIPLSVMMIDIDHFKRINDSHGHLMGDKVLKAVARELRSRLRSADDIGRFGGEEFLVVLPNTAAADAESLARRMSDAVAMLRVEIPIESGRCTISIGCTVSIGISEWSFSSPDENLHTLIHRADMALLSAKQSGRNRVARIDRKAPAEAAC